MDGRDRNEMGPISDEIFWRTPTAVEIPPMGLAKASEVWQSCVNRNDGGDEKLSSGGCYR